MGKDRNVSEVRAFVSAHELVALAKEKLDITNHNGLLDEEDIREICKWVATLAPDAIEVNGELTFGKTGIGMLLFVSLSEFPRFYEKYELSQPN